MYQIQLLNKISPLALERLGSDYACSEEAAAPQAVLVRSAAMHDMQLSPETLCVARAGAGVNNIPVDRFAQEGVVVFNTPGANANAVKELVVAGLLLASRRILPAAEWAKTLKGSGDETLKRVEKGKSQFVGPEIAGKTLGVVGLGAIGILVAQAARALGMRVVGYDPFLSVQNAVRLPSDVRLIQTLQEMYPLCDYITLHLPLSGETRGMICRESLAQMRDGVRILNFARDGLVCEEDLLSALASGKVARYVTDFPTDGFIGVENVVALPHLGASTPESEDNCAVMAADEIRDYLENGNICNSVNFPALQRAPVTAGVVRVCILHTDGASAQVAAAVMGAGEYASAKRGNVGYTVCDTDAAGAQKITAALGNVDGVLRLRLLEK